MSITSVSFISRSVKQYATLELELGDGKRFYHGSTVAHTKVVIYVSTNCVGLAEHYLLLDTRRVLYSFEYGVKHMG